MGASWPLLLRCKLATLKSGLASNYSNYSYVLNKQSKQVLKRSTHYSYALKKQSKQALKRSSSHLRHKCEQLQQAWQGMVSGLALDA